MLPRSEGLEDFSGIQDAVRVESFLDRLHGFPLGVVEHETHEFGLGQAYPVLAAYGSVKLHHLAHEISQGDASSFRLVGVHHPAGQAHFHRLGLADRAGEPLRSAHARRDAQLDLGLAELCVFAGDDEIARQCDIETCAGGCPIDRCNDWLFKTYLKKAILGHGRNLFRSSRFSVWSI